MRIAEFLAASLEDGNPDVFIPALGHVAKARGMTEIAKDSGLGRESLYKALKSGSNFDMIRSKGYCLLSAFG
jgi:probable addiction module antidote protein